MNVEVESSASVLVTQSQELLQWINGALFGTANDRNDGVNRPSPREAVLQDSTHGGEIHARIEVHGHIDHIRGADPQHRRGLRERIVTRARHQEYWRLGNVSQEAA